MTKPERVDNRKADVGDKVVVQEGGEVHAGVVYGVRYQDGDGNVNTTWDRINFVYIVQIGQRDTGETRDITKEVIKRLKQFDYKTSKWVEKDTLVTEKIGTEPIMEPIYIDATDDQPKV